MTFRVLFIGCASDTDAPYETLSRLIGRQAQITRVETPEQAAECLSDASWPLVVVAPPPGRARDWLARVPPDTGRTLVVSDDPDLPPSADRSRRDWLVLDRHRFRRLAPLLSALQEAGWEGDLFDALPVGVLELDRDGRVCRLNAAWTALVGQPPEHCLGRPLVHWVHGPDRPVVEEALRELLGRPGRRFSGDIRVGGDRDGRWLSLGLRGSATGALGGVHDIHDRKIMEQQLFQDKEQALLTLESIADGVITLDGGGRVDYLNPAAEGFTGWSGADARGHGLHEVCALLDANSGQPLLGLDPAPDSILDALSGQTVLIRRDDGELAMELSVAPLGGRGGWVLVFHDVTQTRQLAQMLSFQATHDALTGLLNRHEFERRLEWLLVLAKEDRVEHTLCYLDLDQFKVINDTCGHVAGDELLRRLTELLRDHVRDADTVARLGGDEFGILLEYCPADKAVILAERLREAIHAFRFVWEDRAFNVGVSIGLVPLTHHSQSLEQVLSAADSACYAAKEAGRNRVRLYQPDDAEMARRQGEMQWVSRITEALEQDRFCLFFQDIRPLEDPSEGRHCEILLRLRDGRGGLVPPGAFLPAAERYNLIQALDRWVVRHTLDWFAGHPRQLAGLSVCTINLSGQTFGDESFLEFVSECFQRSVVPPRSICFEITETAAISNMTRAVKFIGRLKDLGCHFALDDFGAGMSSFAYLKNLPVDYLKIDGSFVRGITSDAIDLAMLRSINEIGQVMGMKTIAEFVENDQVLAKLREVGVDYAQGYGIAKPRPLDEMEQP